MTRDPDNQGDRDTFKQSWNTQPERLYTHWTRGEPSNQVQLAFRNHWEVFQLFMNDPLFGGGKRVLEAGAGRGSLSCYFADAGFDCTLLDISEKVVETAKEIFGTNGLEGAFTVGDVQALPYPDGAFDAVFSIGLLEHFQDTMIVLKEQVRVLRPGGLLVGYVVPEWECDVQKKYEWVRAIIGAYHAMKGSPKTDKHSVFRTFRRSPHYIRELKHLGLHGVRSAGAYPLPMLSHSIEFPFSLMPPEAEQAFVDVCKSWLAERRSLGFLHPWFCKEGYGQAFFVWGYKS